MFKINTHSMMRIVGRLGLDPLHIDAFVRTIEATAEKIDITEAEQIANIASHYRNNTYYKIKHPLKDEYIVAVVHGGLVVTFLTNDIQLVYDSSFKRVGNTTRYKTLGGEEIVRETKRLRRMRR